MNNIIKFNDFSNKKNAIYSILEGLTGATVVKEKEEDSSKMSPLYVSNRLLLILNKINNDPIAKKILDNIDKKEIMYQVSFLDYIKEEPKMVSYFQGDRLKRIDIDKFKNPDANHEVWTSKLRSPINWGTLINKIFPSNFSAAEINNFYDRFVPLLNDDDDELFKLVKGEEIRHWYLESNWDGGLGSCMRYKKCQPFLDIYVNNTEKCNLLVYFSKNDPKKVVARALIWKGIIKPNKLGSKKPSELTEADLFTFMDRVYYSDKIGGKIEATFHKYAIENGWLYKKGDSFYLNGVLKSDAVTTRLKPAEYELYPYMDTMSYYTPKSGRASSEQGNAVRDPRNPDNVLIRLNLRSQDGGSTAVR